MWDYLEELTERSINSARNTFWFIRVCLIKGGFLLLYFLCCFAIGVSGAFRDAAIINFCIVALDFLAYEFIWGLTNRAAKNKVKNQKRNKRFISALKIACSILRPAGTTLLFVNVIRCINVGAGNLAINILVLLFTSASLAIFLIKECVIMLVNYVKYKAKKELEEFDRFVTQVGCEIKEEIGQKINGI